MSGSLCDSAWGKAATVKARKQSSQRAGNWKNSTFRSAAKNNVRRKVQRHSREKLALVKMSGRLSAESGMRCRNLGPYRALAGLRPVNKEPVGVGTLGRTSDLAVLPPFPLV